MEKRSLNRIMAELGITGALNGYLVLSAPILKYVETLGTPDSQSAALIGYTIQELQRGNFDDAIRIIEKTDYFNHSNVQQLEAILAFAYFVAGRVDDYKKRTVPHGLFNIDSYQRKK